MSAQHAQRIAGQIAQVVPIHSLAAPAVPLVFNAVRNGMDTYVRPWLEDLMRETFNETEQDVMRKDVQDIVQEERSTI